MRRFDQTRLINTEKDGLSAIIIRPAPQVHRQVYGGNFTAQAPMVAPPQPLGQSTEMIFRNACAIPRFFRRCPKLSRRSKGEWVIFNKFVQNSGSFRTSLKTSRKAGHPEGAALVLRRYKNPGTPQV
jgi:hypothetical protein